MPTRGASPGFRTDIEGLRGIAVLLVVGCHCGVSALAGGFVGVDVFFVLSGYLITGLLVAEVRTTSRLDLPSFYARRARRLLPASALVLVVTVVAATVALAPQELAFAGRAARAAALYVSNVFFDLNAADYFAADVQSNPLLHTWSLGVEEQFYLLWPALIAIGFRLDKSLRLLAPILVSVSIVSLVVAVRTTATAPTFAFYELPARAWEFGAGGAFALLPTGTHRVRAVYWQACGGLGMLAILAAATLIPAGAGFPGWIALVPVAGTLAVLVAGARLPQRGVGALLALAPLQYLGARSYSWYLWHWPFVVFCAAVFPGASVGAKIIASGGALAAAALTFRTVERPVRKNAFLAARPRGSLALAAAVTLGCVGVALFGVRYAGTLSDSTVLRPIVAATTDIADMPRQDCVTQGVSPQLKRCDFGAPASSFGIALFGDSHAVQWFNPVRTVATAKGWRLTTFLKSDCAASDNVELPPRSGSAACGAWRAEAIEHIKALRPAVVLMASFNSKISRGAPRGRAAALESLRQATRRTLEQFVAAGLRVVVVRDTPLPPHDIPTCLARGALHAWLGAVTCDFERSAALDPGAAAAEDEAAAGLPGVEFLDLNSEICPTPACPAARQGIPIYRDDNHLTGTFAGSLAPAVAARLQHLAPELP